MDPIQFMITTAGLDAMVNAQGGGTDPIQIVSLGITENNFVMAPTITNLPGELKRIDSISGESTSETIIHMTAQDVSEDIYELRGLGLYLADGTLFAVYSQETPIFRKVSIAFFLLALDISFENAVSGDIVFGDTSFLLPPASETIKGIAEIADADEATEGTDDSRIMTPAKVKLVLDAIAAAIGSEVDLLAAALAALVARTITGEGLVSGGGDLSESRALTVQAASAAETADGLADDKAITPAGLVDALGILGGWNASIPVFKVPGTPIIVQTGQVRGTYTTELAIPVVLPVAFPTACIWVGPITYISADDSLRDIFVQMRERTASGFNVYYQAGDSSDNRIDGFDWIAIGY